MMKSELGSSGIVRRVGSRLTGLVLLVLWGLSATACSENPVQDYGNKVLDAYDRSGKSANHASVVNLQRAVEAYRAANGYYPPSLQDLEGFAGQTIDPALYQYSPSTGKIEAVR